MADLEWDKLVNNIIMDYTEINPNATKGEQLEAIYNYVETNYSCEITGEGYVYCGKLEDGTPVYQVVDKLVKTEGNGYISSTEAGKLFNNEGFSDSITEIFRDKLADGYSSSSMWEGKEFSGTLKFRDGSTAQAMNDAFSSMYVRNLKCSNVNTVIIGDVSKGVDSYNAFARTEWDLIIKNRNIQTVNGIDKNVFQYIFENAPEGQQYESLIDAIKTSQAEKIGNINYKVDKFINESGKQVSVVTEASRTESNGFIKLTDNIPLEEQSKYLNGGNRVRYNELTELNQSVTVYLNDEGKVIGRSYENSTLKSIAKDNVPKEYTHKTSVKNFENFADDATMREKLGAGYDELGAKERFELKEIDWFIRSSDSLIDTARIEQATLDYIKGAGKTVSELGEVDQLLIEYGSKIYLQDKVPIRAINSLLEAAADSEKIQTVLNGFKTGGKVAGTVLVAAVCAITVCDTVNRANQAMDEGKYGEAAGIVTGSCANLALTFIAGEVLAGEFAAYGAGLGFMVGGPIGAIIGGAIGGLAGFGLAMFSGWAVENACTELGELWDYLFNDASSAVRYVADPLVVDLLGNGFNITDVKEGVYFDEDAMGLVEKTGWITEDDALLALDINNAKALYV